MNEFGDHGGSRLKVDGGKRLKLMLLSEVVNSATFLYFTVRMNPTLFGSQNGQHYVPVLLERIYKKNWNGIGISN